MGQEEPARPMVACFHLDLEQDVVLWISAEFAHHLRVGFPPHRCHADASPEASHISRVVALSSRSSPGHRRRGTATQARRPCCPTAHRRRRLPRPCLGRVRPPPTAATRDYRRGQDWQQAVARPVERRQLHRFDVLPVLTHVVNRHPNNKQRLVGTDSALGHWRERSPRSR